jgi:hypothetical protein
MDGGVLSLYFTDFSRLVCETRKLLRHLNHPVSGNGKNLLYRPQLLFEVHPAVLSFFCGTIRSVLTKQAAQLPEEHPDVREWIASHGCRNTYTEFNPEI